MCYSAANEFTNAIRSLDNVTIIGDKTGGGGGMPISSELYNGWQIGYSTNPMFDIEKNHTESGIEPDIYVPQSKLEVIEKNNSRKESNLRGHLDEKDTDSIETKDQENKETKNTQEDDYQLNRALDLIKSISVYETLKKES